MTLVTDYATYQALQNIVFEFSDRYEGGHWSVAFIQTEGEEMLRKKL